MNKRFLLALGLLAMLTPCVAPAVVFTNVGLDSTTGGDWRTTSVGKLLDGDRDSVYGTLGYFAFATGNFNVGDGGVFSAFDVYGGVLANGGLSLSQGAGPHSLYSGAYPLIDNPTLTPSPSVLDTNAGFIYAIGSAAPGFYPLLNVTVGAGMPENFRLGIMDAGNNGANAAFALYTATSTNSIALGAWPGAPRYVFFDVIGATQGSTFSIAVSTTDGINPNNAFGLSALAVDLIVPEPSSIMLLGLGGWLLWRIRSIRRTT